jgi:hypothetical protein
MSKTAELLSNLELELGDKEDCPPKIALPVSPINVPLPKPISGLFVFPRTTKTKSCPDASSNNVFMSFMAASQPWSHKAKPQKTTPSLPSVTNTITHRSPSHAKPNSLKSPDLWLNSRLPYKVVLRETIKYPISPSYRKRKRSGSDVGDDPQDLGTTCRSSWDENAVQGGSGRGRSAQGR